MFSTRRVFVLMAAAGALMLLSTAALADWDPTNPNDLARAKWIQLPDETPNGMDVNATSPKILADDWMCNDPRPVTDIDIWYSWNRDVVPPTPDQFPLVLLQIWSDQPAIGDQFSHPSKPLCSIDATAVVTVPLKPYFQFPDGSPGEGWYDPNTGEYNPDSDRNIWQLNFDVSKNPFPQVKGTTYWLVAQAFFPDGSTQFQAGWKTTDPKNHQLDNAVWTDGFLGDPGAFNWNELRHPETKVSLDLSFVITVPEPGTLLLLAVAGLGLGLLAWRRHK